MIEEQLQYMYGLSRFGIKPGLDTMRRLLDELGNPQLAFKSVHITGTNGKGSCAAMLDAIISSAGYRVALYTSPHLFSFNERIRINGHPITDQELSVHVQNIRAAVVRAKIKPTFFEFTTAIAFKYFSQQNIDLAIIEVGMGGGHDATNVIQPLVSVITNIDLDHMTWLGTNKAAIADEKAGIIKPNTPIVVGDKDSTIVQYLKTRASAQRAPFYWTHRHSLRISQSNLEGQRFSRQGQTYQLALLGRHQIDNAAIVLDICAILSKVGFSLSVQSIKHGLESAHWPGRMQLISRYPYTLIDGAHNSAGMTALYRFITAPETKPATYDVLITGMKADKDITVLRDQIAPLFTHVITTEGSYEAMSAQVLADCLQPALTGSVIALPQPSHALIQAQKIGEKKQLGLLVAGSLYFIPLILQLIRAQNSS